MIHPQLRAIASDLRSFMRQVPSAVVVVTTRMDNISKGITCSSFTSVSLNPPIVSFCVHGLSSSSAYLERFPFAINVLSSQQVGQSIRFSSYKTQTDFDVQHYLDSKTNLPILQESLGALVCSPVKTLMMGDHLVVFGLVDSILPSLGSSSNAKMTPLLYYESSYRGIGADALFLNAFEQQKLSFQDWTHRAHLRVAYQYLCEYNTKEEAYNAIRSGILEYNKANQLLVKHGYNDTITRFFVHVIHLCIQREKGIDFADFLQKHPKLDSFSLIYSYYDQDLLFSNEAAICFTPPNLQPLPTSIDDIGCEFL